MSSSPARQRLRSRCPPGLLTCPLGGVKLRGLREGPPKGRLPPPLLGSLPGLVGLTGYLHAHRRTARWAGSFNTMHDPSSPKGISPSLQNGQLPLRVGAPNPLTPRLDTQKFPGKWPCSQAWGPTFHQQEEASGVLAQNLDGYFHHLGE